MDDILKMKIVRDFNKIHYNSNSLWVMSQINKIKSKYNPTYLNLIELIKNDWLQKVMIPTKKFSISDLNNIDIDFLNDISFYRNIRIVDSPLFYHLYLENTGPNTSEVKTRALSVQDVRNIDTKELIRKHPFDLFYIYTISRTSARWNQLKDDKGLLRYERKLKLEHLKNINLMY